MRFPELRGKITNIRYPAFVEPKLDGEPYWYEVARHALHGRNEVHVTGVLVDKLDSMHLTHDVLGELYTGDGYRGELYNLAGAEWRCISFGVHDINMPGTYMDRREELTRMFYSHPGWLVPSALVNDLKEVNFFFKYYTTAGYEGIVIKNADSRLVLGPCSWVKMKLHEDIDATVLTIDPSRETILVGYAEIIGKCTRMKETSVKVSNKVKATLDVGDIVEIEHQGFLKNGLRHPVFKRKKGAK